MTEIDFFSILKNQFFKKFSKFLTYVNFLPLFRKIFDRKKLTKMPEICLKMGKNPLGDAYFNKNDVFFNKKLCCYVKCQKYLYILIKNKNFKNK